MPDILIISLAALLVISLLKIYSDMPQDSDGRIILSIGDRIVGGVVLLCAAAGIVFVKVDLYGIGNPLLFLSPILIAAYVIYTRMQKKK